MIEYKEQCNRVEGHFLTGLLYASYSNADDFTKNITTKEEEHQDIIKKHIYLYNKYGFTIVYRLDRINDTCKFVVEGINESSNAIN